MRGLLWRHAPGRREFKDTTTESAIPNFTGLGDGLHAKVIETERATKDNDTRPLDGREAMGPNALISLIGQAEELGFPSRGVHGKPASMERR